MQLKPTAVISNYEEKHSVFMMLPQTAPHIFSGQTEPQFRGGNDGWKAYLLKISMVVFRLKKDGSQEHTGL